MPTHTRFGKVVRVLVLMAGFHALALGADGLRGNDPTGAKLAQQRCTFADSVSAVSTDVLKALDRAIKSGKGESITTLQAEREEFVKRGTWPASQDEPLLVRRAASAKSKFEDRLEEAVDAYRRKGDEAGAARAAAELDELRRERALTPWQPHARNEGVSSPGWSQMGSSWQNDGQSSARLRLGMPASEQYQVRFTIERLSGEGAVRMRLPSSGHQGQVTLVIDGEHRALYAVGTSETPRENGLLASGVEVALTLGVRRRSLSLDSAAARELDIRDEFESVKAESGGEAGEGISIECDAGTKVRVGKFRVRAVVEEAENLPAIEVKPTPGKLTTPAPRAVEPGRAPAAAVPRGSDRLNVKTRFQGKYSVRGQQPFTCEAEVVKRDVERGTVVIQVRFQGQNVERWTFSERHGQLTLTDREGWNRSGDRFSNVKGSGTVNEDGISVTWDASITRGNMKNRPETGTLVLNPN